MDWKFTSVDVEGNGADPPEAVEIAATRICLASGIGEPRCWLVRPRRPIQWRAKRVHNIANADVAQAPTIDEVRQDIRDYIDGHVVVAHNAGVDLAVLGRDLNDWRPVGVVDTLKVSKKLVPHAPSFNLQILFDWLGLTLPETHAGRTHRAGHDSAVCALLFLKLVSLAEEKGLTVQALITRGNKN